MVKENERNDRLPSGKSNGGRKSGGRKVKIHLLGKRAELQKNPEFSYVWNHIQICARGCVWFCKGVRWLGGWLFVECKALALPPAVN